MTDRSRALDGLRALAALSVVGFHSWLYRPDRQPGARTQLTDHVFFELHLGLICFFVLSGFLLYRPFVRIGPAYYVSLALCLALYAAIGYRDLIPDADRLPFFAAFAQNYSMGSLMQINPVTWTLCVEAAFYLVLPQTPTENIEISDEDLEKVAGGIFTDKWGDAEIICGY